MITVKRLLGFFIACLFLSGVTVFPLHCELQTAVRLIPAGSGMHDWLFRASSAYNKVEATYPFLLYGYDWLAFAHIVLAVLFVGAYRDPIKNKWVIEFGLIACVLVLPLALIAGPLRGIPLGWRCIDMSFGVVGFIVLAICQTKLKSMTRIAHH